MTPDDFVNAISDPLQSIGALHYFDPAARVAAEALGLDLFRFYFAGRGGVLGPVSSEVLQSAFGYFDPPLVNKMWSTSKERCDVTEAGAAQLGVAYTIGERDLENVEGLGEAASALGKLTSSVDLAGLALFAAFAGQPIPESEPAAFMHQTILYRELRGSVHLAAISATGCRSRAAHQIKRPDDLEMFGYKEPLEIPDGERSLYESVEPLTNATMVVHASQSLSDTERKQIAATVEAAHAALFGS